MTINDMFATLKRCMEPDLESVIKLLMRKGGDGANAFIADEVERVLIGMCNHC